MFAHISDELGPLYSTCPPPPPGIPSIVVEAELCLIGFILVSRRVIVRWRPLNAGSEDNDGKRYRSGGAEVEQIGSSA